ncbi:MAG: YidC/Oxa1 family membrane protein insertase [Patescibacteria group bacterium]|nr:YidC/Oxa1 family membrane protein insertase [Patescibacteria group bacterium]
MSSIFSLFNTLLVNPIINVLVIIYQALNFLRIPYSLGFSIILLTIVVRLILYPFTNSQLKASKKMQDLAPHLSNLKNKHKGDAKMLQQETMRLYKEHGVNPAAGCLPVLIQLPIIWALYSVLQKVVGNNVHQVVSDVNNIIYFNAFKLTKPWDQMFFGIPLGQNPSQLIGKVGFIILLVPLITGLLQFIQSKMMFTSQPKPQNNQNNKEDFSSAFQKQSLFIFPIMIGFFSYTFPIGLSLYWNTFTIFGILQQYKLQGLGGLNEWIKKR